MGILFCRERMSTASAMEGVGRTIHWQRGLMAALRDDRDVGWIENTALGLRFIVQSCVLQSQSSIGSRWGMPFTSVLDMNTVETKQFTAATGNGSRMLDIRRDEAILQSPGTASSKAAQQYGRQLGNVGDRLRHITGIAYN